MSAGPKPVASVPPMSLVPESTEVRVPPGEPPRYPSYRVVLHEPGSGMQLRVADVPARWLDKLFVASCSIPTNLGEYAVVEWAVRTLAEIFPDHGVGAYVVRPGEAARIVRYVPAACTSLPLGDGPPRLFAGFSAEIVVEAGEGISLHLGLAEGSFGGEASPEHDMMRRAALAVERGIESARAHEREKLAAREVSALSAHLVQTEKLASLGQLAAGIVHELNNPLTSIVAYTDVLLRKQLVVGGEPEDVERLRRIGESAARMLRFTRDLMAYARPARETHVAVSLHGVVDQALAFCEHVLDDSHGRVERLFAPEGIFVRGLPEQLTQVFVNLVTNACHALPSSNGVLWVRTRRMKDDGAAEVVVEDNGEGIPPEHIAQVFAPFFTTKAPGRGTGLGLSIVKNILENHDAHIRVEPRPGGGTRFVLQFPLVDM